ncbi:MAG: trypsin-like peptidase domain-containing protein [Labilithrix sp.]|nr:trypsin-like peptidase domain-containing protein [Labilithrix sp.]
MSTRALSSRVAGLVGLVGLAACTAEVQPGEGRKATTSNQFFENSVRRDATAAEASRVAQLTTSKCAAFFLENTANKTYIATARHCVEFAITTWCTNDGGVVDNAGTQGRCTRIVAADATRDIAVFEANLPHASTGDSTLRLASYVPKISTKLIMTGYPADSDPQTARRGRLTTTASCWTLGGEVASPYAGQDQNTLDKSAQHNCSTYGGNSGGPMYIENTREAIGLPFTYIPDDYKRNSATDLSTAAFLALMSDFVSVHRSTLTAAGIVISSGPDATPTDTGTPPPVDAEPTDAPDDGSTTGPQSDDADDLGDGEEDETEEAPAKKKKKRRPAPVAMNQGCSSAPGAAHDGWPLALVGLGLAVGVARARRRA